MTRQWQERKLTVADAVSEAYGILEELGQEMREAFDNTPENFQQSGVGEARGEAADLLEGLSEPDTSGKFGEMEFTHKFLPPKKGKRSRSDRRGEAVELLDSAISFLNDLELKDQFGLGVDEFVSAIEDLKAEADEVNFPGMYG